MILLLFMMNLYYIDQPFSGLPPHAEFTIQLRFGPEGEIIGFFDVGLFDRFSLGMSYGASNLIGAGDPGFYEIPGVQARIIALEEGFMLPLVILGFDNQGYGGYGAGRYTIKSKGIYCQIGKTVSYPGITFMPSLGVNYCFEGDDQVDMFGGIKMLFGASAAFLLDYCPNFGDDSDRNKGYFNMGLQIIFYEELFFEFAMRDMFGNSIVEDNQFNRMIKLGFSQSF